MLSLSLWDEVLYHRPMNSKFNILLFDDWQSNLPTLESQDIMRIHRLSVSYKCGYI